MDGWMDGSGHVQEDKVESGRIWVNYASPGCICDEMIVVAAVTLLASSQHHVPCALHVRIGRRCHSSVIITNTTEQHRSHAASRSAHRAITHILRHAYFICGCVCIYVSCCLNCVTRGQNSANNSMCDNLCTPHIRFRFRGYTQNIKLH